MGWPAPALRRSWCYLACPRPSINVRLEQLARDGPEPMEDVASAAAQVGSGDVEAKATYSFTSHTTPSPCCRIQVAASPVRRAA